MTHVNITHFEQAIINEHEVSLSASDLKLNAKYQGYSRSGLIYYKGIDMITLTGIFPIGKTKG